MAKSKKTTFNLRILEIKIVQFSQFDLVQEFNNKTIPLVEYQTGFNFKVFENEKKIGCLTTVKIKILETNENFAEMKVETIFEVLPFDEAVKPAGEVGRFTVVNSLLFNVASVSVSTLRGILYEKFKGSLIQKEIYPLADLSQMFLGKNTI